MVYGVLTPLHSLWGPTETLVILLSPRAYGDPCHPTESPIDPFHPNPTGTPITTSHIHPTPGNEDPYINPPPPPPQKKKQTIPPPHPRAKDHLTPVGTHRPYILHLPYSLTWVSPFLDGLGLLYELLKFFRRQEVPNVMFSFIHLCQFQCLPCNTKYSYRNGARK